MRIVAGEWRGRRITAPRDATVRPTADRTREAWMSILQHDIPGARVADLCAGSGALGLETLSRGAASCDFVDLSAAAVDCIRANAVTLGAADRCVVHRGDAERFVRDARLPEWDLVVADPPYGQGIATRLVEAWLERPYARILSVEHDAHEVLPGWGESRAYGVARITILRRAPVDAEP